MFIDLFWEKKTKVVFLRHLPKGLNFRLKDYKGVALMEFKLI